LKLIVLDRHSYTSAAFHGTGPSEIEMTPLPDFSRPSRPHATAGIIAGMSDQRKNLAWFWGALALIALLVLSLFFAQDLWLALIWRLADHTS
jgi:hypothetical protein